MKFSNKKLTLILPGLGIFIASYDIAAISVSLLVLKNLWHLTDGIISIVGASAFIGAIFGGFFSGILADKYGRKQLLVLDFITYIIASIGSSLSYNIETLILFRILVGIGIGADFTVIFPYLAEVLPVETRGKDMAAIMFTANFGMVVAYGLGGIFVTFGPVGWRLVLLFGGIMAIPFMIMRTKIVESGLWIKNRKKGIRDIVNNFHRREKRNVIVSSIAWFSYQVGDQALSIFLPLFLFSVLDLNSSYSSYSSLLIKLITIPAAFMTVILINRIGRKPLQIYGFLGRALGLIGTGIFLIYFLNISKILIILFLFIAYFFGAVGPDKTIVIAPSEQFNTSIRATGQGISESSGRFGGVVGIISYGFIVQYFGSGYSIFFLAIFAIVGFIVSRFYMVETNPRNYTNLNDIEEFGRDV